MSETVFAQPIWLAGLTVVVFLLAGCLKGVIGMGLPTLAMALLGLVMPTYEAAALLVIPAFVTNLWQFLAGPYSVNLVRRLWPMLVAQIFGVAASWALFRNADAALLSVLLGLSLLAYAVIGLFGVAMTLSRERHRPAAPIAGVVSGLITGVTGTMVVPAVMYLQSLGLKKEELVQSMGLSFSVSSLVLGAALFSAERIDSSVGALGMLALVAAAVGMPIGQWLRKHLPETVFRKLFFVVIGAVGLSLVARNLSSL